MEILLEKATSISAGEFPKLVTCKTYLALRDRPNKAPQLTANPLRGLSAAELGG